MLRRLLIALFYLVSFTAAAQVPPQASAVGFNTLVYGPTLKLGRTGDPVTSYPLFTNGVNIVPFSFFGISWGEIGIVQNSDGSITMDGSGQNFGDGLTTGASGVYRSLPTSFTGQSFAGGYYMEAVMKGQGPMSFWANDLETMNGAGEGWGLTPFSGQSQTLVVGGSVTNGDGISVLIYEPWLNNGAAINLQFSASGSTSTVATNIAAAINSNTIITAAGVGASASGATVTITSPANQEPAIRINPAVVSGSFTESFDVTTYGNGLETDMAEFDSTNDYAWAFHNWHGTNTSDVAAVWGGPLSSCPGGGPTCTWIGPTLNGVTVDFTQYHKYGALYVPATNSTSGYMQYYFDGTAVSNKLLWNKYNPTNGPPPVANAAGNCVPSIYISDHNNVVCTVPANTAWSILDRRHMVPIFGGSDQGNVTVQSFSVWQNAAGMAADLPPITGGGGGGTGQYHVSNGQIIDPNGKLFIPTGANLALEMAANIVTNNQAQPLTTLLPGINYVRLVIETGTPFQNYPTPASMATVINQMTAAGIVVDIDDHSCNGGALEESSGAVNPPPWCVPPTSGSALTTVTNWYTALAQYYSNNPRVWFASVNEPCAEVNTCSYSAESVLSTYQTAIYNAVRVAGNSSNIMVMLQGIGGGNCQTVGTNSSLPSAPYATMTNIIWELHSYYNGPGTFAGALAQLQGSVSAACGYVAAQSIHSADGVVPVVFGEWGTQSGDPSGSDAGPMIQAIESVASTNSIGSSAWTIYEYAPTWQMVTPPPTNPGTFGLTGWGSGVGAEIAQVSALSGGGGSGGSKVPPPAPLSGSVTTQTWVAYNQSFSGIQLACGKPFHFIVLPPAQYNSTAYKYPLLIWLHPDFQGDPWYLGTNTNPLFLDNDESASFNTVTQLTNYPAFVVSPYADQTNGNGSNGSCSGDGNDAVENWGGWTNNGLTGSGTVYSGDTGPNVFAVLDMINFLEATYSIDPSRIFVEGFSLGGIGAEYMAQKFNLKNGNPSIFAAAASMAGVLQINGFAAGPTTAQETAMTSVPVWWFGGTGDTQSVQSQWNEPMFTALGGGSFPPAITSVADNRAGTSAMEYTLCPTCGHQDTDANGAPVWVNQTIMNWMFGVTGGGGGCTTNCTVTSTSWDPARVPSSMALSNNNQTASATSVPSGSTGVVWSTTSYSTGKYCFGVIASTTSNNWTAGLANTSFPSFPASLAGLGGDQFGQGTYVVNPPQYIYYNGVALTTGTTADVSGDEVDECVDFGTDQIWVSTAVMRANSTPWNNSGTATPATETGGLSISGLTCPCYIVFQTEDSPSVATLNAGGPLAVGSVPSGFSIWAPPASNSSHSPMFINLGQNDNHRQPANDDAPMWYIPVRYEK